MAEKKIKQPKIPDVEIYAHPLGNIQWECPNCGNLHSSSKNFAKRGVVECGRCQRNYRVGLAFEDVFFMYPRIFEGGPYNGYVANQFGLEGLKADRSGRVYGRIDWECPDCHKTYRTSMPFEQPSLTCCKKWFVYPILYSSVQRQKAITPHDWAIVFSKSHETNETIQPLSISETN